MEFLLLGPLTVCDRGEVLPVQRGNQRTVLAALLLQANRVVSVGELAAAVWDGDEPPSAQVTVQNYVKRLRRALGDLDRTLISTQPRGYQIRAEPGDLDLLRFRTLLASAQSAARQGTWEAAAEEASAALALWRGEPLADIESELLVMREAPRLAEIRLQAEETRIDAGLHLGRHAELIGDLRQLTAGHPLRERFWSLLMLALFRSGRQADALAAYRQARAALVDQLAAEPGAELREVHRQVLAGDDGLVAYGQPPPAARAAAPPASAMASSAEQPAPPLQAAVVPRQAAAVPRQAAAVPRQALPPLDGRAAAPSRQETVAPPGDRVEAPPQVPAVPWQLPAPVRHFTGRSAELAALTGMLGRDEEEAKGLVVISAIDGTAGVGKTALAVHWAHQAAADFPDGQLYVNLRGFGPSAPMSPAEAVSVLLAALGVPFERWPPGFDAQVGLYRSAAAGRRLLILLDNARDTDQVRPLLPGSPGSLVLVTSRASLAGLAVSQEAHLLTLGVLSEYEAGQLLDRRIGSGRVAAEPGAVNDLIRLCARLPLALAIVAARACARPDFPLASQAAELRDEPGRLDTLDAGDLASSVRAVISWSYQSLSGPAARMFRLLGLHPGPDVTASAAASAAGVALPAARRCLRELTHASLLSEQLPGRFGFHDLLRAYAADQASAAEDQQARHEATGRILDHYLYTAFEAACLISPVHDRLNVPPPRPGIRLEHLTSQQHALDWMEAEHQVLFAATTLADSSGFESHAWQIPWAMAQFLAFRGRWRDMAAAQGTALAAATRLGHRAGQAESLRLLANACVRLGDHDQALIRYTAAVSLYQELGDRLGEAKVRVWLGIVAQRQGRSADHLSHSEQALRLYQAAGDRRGEAGALNNVGYALAMLGDYQQARITCRKALSLNAQLGLRYVEAHTWDSLGYAEQHLGNLAEATTCYQRAFTIFGEFGDRYFQAITLTHMGDARRDCGDLQRAREAWQQAVDILDELDHSDADGVRAKLRSASPSDACQIRQRLASDDDGGTGPGRQSADVLNATA
jgi:DNA-binding SARP family transcriptional activator/tetratricopeptide (TPR) repeat protein